MNLLEIPFRTMEPSTKMFVEEIVGKFICQNKDANFFKKSTSVVKSSLKISVLNRIVNCKEYSIVKKSFSKNSVQNKVSNISI